MCSSQEKGAEKPNETQKERKGGRDRELERGRARGRINIPREREQGRVGETGETEIYIHVITT